MHARRVALNHQHGTVQVGNQSGHAVALGMDQAARILAVLAEQTQVFAHPDCICDFGMPPSFVGQGIVESQHAHGDACVGGIVSPAEARALVGEDLDPIPSFRLPFNAFDAAAEDPGVAATDALVALGFQGHARMDLGSLVHAPKLGVLSTGCRREDPTHFNMVELASRTPALSQCWRTCLAKHPMTWAQFVQKFDARGRPSWQVSSGVPCEAFFRSAVHVSHWPHGSPSMSREMKVDAGCPAFEAMDVARQCLEASLDHLPARPVDHDMFCSATRFKPFDAKVRGAKPPFNEPHGVQLGQALGHIVFVWPGGKRFGQAARSNCNGVAGMACGPGVNSRMQRGQRRGVDDNHWSSPSGSRLSFRLGSRRAMRPACANKFSAGRFA